MPLSSVMKKNKNFLHDIFFKEVFSHLKYALDLFRLTLTKEEFALFNWTTLKSEATTFIDKKGREKRTDLQFSVQMKDSQERFKLLFLVEHKSYQDSQVLLQMLSYQTGMYEHIAHNPHFKPAKGLIPVLPILVYQGKDREWRGSLEFQAGLNWTADLKRRFGKNVLNFQPRMLNISALDLKKGVEVLISYPALFILQHIWRLDKAKVREFFSLSQDISFEERKFLVSKVVAYVQKYDPQFSWDILQEIEEDITEDKEAIMSLFQDTIDEACQKSHQEGWQKGQLDGIEKGMQQGRQELILKLLESGFDMQAICKGTGLSEEEINKLKNGS